MLHFHNFTSVALDTAENHEEMIWECANNDEKPERLLTMFMRLSHLNGAQIEYVL